MPPQQRSTKEVVDDTRLHLRELVDAHVELAKAEMKEAQAELVRGLLPAGIGAVLGMYIFGLFAVTLAKFLEGYDVVSEPWAWLIVTVFLSVAAIVVLLVARRHFNRFNPTPERTQQSVSETVEWAKSKTGGSN